MSETHRLAEASAYWQRRSRQVLAARVPRSLMIRAGTLAALGGSGAMQAILAACARGARAGEVTSVGQRLEEGAYKYSPYPLVEKYNWRNLPWGGTPYVGGEVREPRAPWASTDMFRGQIGAEGLAFSMLTHVRFGQGANMEQIEFEGDLAKEYKPSPDFAYWDFFLHRGARFHDIPPVNGREVTADDVKYSLDRYRIDSLFSANITFIERIEVSDRYTVRIHTKRPVLFAHQVLAQPNYAIVAPEHAEGDPSYFKTTVVGSGPFKVTYNQDRDRREFVRNDRWHFSDGRYPATRLPFVDKGTNFYFADTNAQDTAFRSGQIDWVSADKKRMDNLLATNPEVNVHAQATAPTDGGLRWWLLQQRPGSPLQDVRVRRAISLSIDRQKVINAWEQGAGTYGSPMGYDATGFGAPPGPEYYSRFWQRYDPGQAKALLAEAGYGNGLELEVLRSPANTEDYYALFEPMMAEAGIRLKFVRQESSIVTSMRTRGDFKGIVLGANARSYAIPIVAIAHFRSDSPTNYGGVNDAQLDKMIDDVYYSLDVDEQMRLMRQIDEYVMDQVYHVAGWGSLTVLMFQPWLHNVANTIHPFFSAAGSWSVGIAWLDERAPGNRGGKKHST